jgi:pSer/pThr/pTyr-binding forkhead associated (FHA) protein
MDVNLVMFKSDGQRKDFPLTNSVSVIGRGEECDLQVPLLNVSRRHCELRVDQDVIRVKDLASSNGTYLNNQRISEGELAAGDRLAIGPIVFTVQVDGQPEEVSPIKSQGQMVAEGAAADGPTVITEDVEIEVEPQAESETEPDAAADIASAPTAVTEAAEAAEVVEPPPAPDPEAQAALALAPEPEADEGESLDPISALEALAAESRKKSK